MSRVISDSVFVGNPLRAYNGAVVDAWLASRTWPGGLPPAEGAAPPLGSPDAGPVTTSAAFGSEGAFDITVPDDDVYLRAVIGSVVGWKLYPASGVAGYPYKGAWDATVTYAAGDWVTSDEFDPPTGMIILHRSLYDGNLNLLPSPSQQWDSGNPQFAGMASSTLTDGFGNVIGAPSGVTPANAVLAWSGATTYAFGDLAIGSNGIVYVSVLANTTGAGANLNNNPVGDDGTNWLVVTFGPATYNTYTGSPHSPGFPAAPGNLGDVAITWDTAQLAVSVTPGNVTVPGDPNGKWSSFEPLNPGSVWSATVQYATGAIVKGSDSAFYIAFSTSFNDDPVGSITGAWVKLT